MGLATAGAYAIDPVLGVAVGALLGGIFGGDSSEEVDVEVLLSDAVRMFANKVRVIISEEVKANELRKAGVALDALLWRLDDWRNDAKGLGSQWWANHDLIDRLQGCDDYAIDCVENLRSLGLPG